jgi:hypothetical protein
MIARPRPAGLRSPDAAFSARLGSPSSFFATSMPSVAARRDIPNRPAAQSAASRDPTAAYALRSSINPNTTR